MATNRYFRFAGQPRHYAAEWHGLPPFPVRRGSRELGEANFYEASAPPFTRYRPLEKSWRTNATAELEEYLRETRDVDEGDALGDVAPGGPPLRPSGPEPLDPGEMPSWEPGYPQEILAMPVGADEPGILGLSRNETRLLAVGGAVALGVFLFKRKKRK
jgi:hypothetical protein